MEKNGKRVILLLAILIVVAFSCTLLFSCNIDDVKEISVTPAEVNVRIGEFNYSDYHVTATYDSGATEEADLTEDMIAAKDRIKLFTEGEYEIPVSYLGKTATIKVNVRRNVFEGATFEDLDVVYNGEFYTVEVKNVPEGTTVTYPSTNRFRNAGEYQASAILRKDAYEMKEMTANVTIRKADYDLSGVSFADQSVGYDGAAHLLEMTGTLPAGLYVDYTITREGGREEKGNSATNAGSYRVEARFSGDYVNYNAIAPRQATLNITQATIDVSELTFEDKTVVYDRTKQTIELAGDLPRGLSVTYINNEHVDAGAYDAIARFTVDDIVNYEAIPDMTAKLTVLKADYDMSAVHFNGTKVTYDGKEKKIEIQGQLPNGVTLTYEGNVGTDAGSYEATARFTSSNVNYNDPASMTATLIIDPASAQMDQIVFERRRFISRKSQKNEMPQWYWDMIFDMEDDERVGYESMLDIYFYDPYLAAKRYAPENVPTGLSVASVKYYETTGWVDDLSAYDGEGAGYIGEEALDHDGYYVVVVTFDGGKNYTGVSPIKTLIRVDTIDYFFSWEQMIYDEEWRNPETGEETGVFMDYYNGFCVRYEDMATYTVGNVTVSYCDCQIFKAYQVGGADALVADEAGATSSLKGEAYEDLADKFVEFIKNTNITYTDTGSPNPREWEYHYSLDDMENEESPSFTAFIEAAELATMEYNDEYMTFPFDLENAAYLPLNDDHDYVAITRYDGGKTAEDYYPLLAAIFGFDNVDDFFGADKVTGNLFDACLDPAFIASAGVSTDTMRAQFAVEGAIYENNGKDTVYIFPFYITWFDADEIPIYEYFYFFCAEIDVSVPGVSSGTVKRYGVLLSDAERFFAFGDAPEQNTILKGRCDTAEVPVLRLYPVTKTVIENGVPTQKPISVGRDFSFVEDNAATAHLIVGDQTVYMLLNEIPGNCAEKNKTYDPADYRFETPQTVYSFCDCDPFASLIEHSGDASAVTKRDKREDHPQMTTEILGEFDRLAALYADFLSNYAVYETEVVNEWKIGVTNRNYNAYKSYFEYAYDMFAKSNHNLGKVADYYLSGSAIIGINRAFTISINSSGNDYSVDKYRLIVAKLFGFTDLDTFTQYADNLAKALVANQAGAGVDSVSARLRYDGAVLTENGSFVLPFAIKSELSTERVLAFVFVDREGMMSIWLSDAKNAFNATNFGEEALAAGDKYTVTIYGRCMLFEDDGYVMKEDMNKNVLEMIDNLLGYATNTFSIEELLSTCSETNDEQTDDTYWRSTNDAIYLFCDCDPLTAEVNRGGDGSVITNRIDRDDHAQMTLAVAEKFDVLTALYQALLSHYTIEGDETQNLVATSGEGYYADYRRLFRYAKALFASVDNRAAKVADYLPSDSVIVGLNKPFVISVGLEYTLEEYRSMVAKLFGFTDGDTLAQYAGALANALSANARGASVSSVAARLLYDGAVLTENGSFVLPYAFLNRTSGEKVLALVFVGADGTIAMWIHNIDAAFALTTFTEILSDSMGRDIVEILGRCVLFESGGYKGYDPAKAVQYVAGEKVKSFASPGSFIVYTPFTDEEGFEVYWFALYAFEREAVYEGADNAGFGTVHKGFYTMVNVASVDDIRAYNDKTIADCLNEGAEA